LANYRGCVVAKELQKIQNSTIRRKTENTLHENAKRQEHQTQYTHVQAGRSYAQATRSNSEQAQNVQECAISQMLLKIMAKLQQQEKPEPGNPRKGDKTRK
jgi:16S rRNA C1402 (ribose-2'-O) methylase RsmI